MHLQSACRTGSGGNTSIAAKHSICDSVVPYHWNPGLADVGGKHDPILGQRSSQRIRSARNQETSLSGRFDKHSKDSVMALIFGLRDGYGARRIDAWMCSAVERKDSQPLEIPHLFPIFESIRGPRGVKREGCAASTGTRWKRVRSPRVEETRETSAGRGRPPRSGSPGGVCGCAQSPEGRLLRG